MKTADFNYELPRKRIAQEPAPVRDACKLLVIDRHTGALEDKVFSDIVTYLRPGDVLVANETRVMPARLLGTKRGSGGAAEVFLLREYHGELCKHTHATNKNGACSDFVRSNQEALWEVLVRPGKRLKPGSGAVVDFTDAHGQLALSAEIVDWLSHEQAGARIARLSTSLPSLDEALHAVGHTPLPPYIKNYTGDDELYQTVYAKRESSAAAPTAGLHFTPELIERITAQGIGWETVELEVGLDTFRIVEEDCPEEHHMHTEFFSIPQKTVEAIAQARCQGGRVIAVGTTSVRSLESAWDAHAPDNGTRRRETQGAQTPDECKELGALQACERAATSLYILPGYRFKVVDALITNFHVPKSTLMMLVSAFSSREHIMAAYRHALDTNYRFLSFGDAMFIA